MFFIIIGIVIALVVITGIVKSSKAAKQNQEKSSAEKATKVLDEKEDFKKFLEFESSSSKADATYRSPSPTAQQIREKEEKLQQLAKHFEQEETKSSVMPSKQMQIQRTIGALQSRLEAQKAQAEATSGSHHQSHCDAKHSGDDKYRVEYVPTMNSIGGKSTEGCQDHYNTRYVKIDEKLDKNLELTQLQRIIVFGEVLNNPKFKRR